MPCGCGKTAAQRQADKMARLAQAKKDGAAGKTSSSYIEMKLQRAVRAS